MTPTTSDLSPERHAVLSAVARMDLSVSVAISQHLGRSVANDVTALRLLGFIREVLSSRKDGTASNLIAITPKGKDALKVYDEQRTEGLLLTPPRRPSLDQGTYMGNDMVAFGSRAGASDALNFPSRVGNELRYRDKPTAPASKKAGARRK